MRSERRVWLERVGLLREVRRLLESRRGILSEQQAMLQGRKERLLSKRVNMAKCLLQEEALRRRAARELPQIHSHLHEALKRWGELTQQEGAPAGSAAPPLCVDDVDVGLLLQLDAANKAGGGTAVSARSPGRTLRSPTPFAGALSRAGSISPPPSCPPLGFTTTTTKRNISNPSSAVDRRNPRSTPFRVVRRATSATPSVQGVVAPRIRPKKVVEGRAAASNPSLHTTSQRSLSPPPRPALRHGLSPVQINNYARTGKTAVGKATREPFHSIRNPRTRTAHVSGRNITTPHHANPEK
ncbi:unnamed protein product [Phytomonas sp. Hart1]|nr:unnamed protein product [Phytomonas sp. Hart1]|eukprot:CCW67786.1 unnamed protein product [Phytomonas sp. isolate Hart1]